MTVLEDEPADLVDRLRARGFTVGGEEALVLGETAGLVHPVTAKGARLRRAEVDDDAAFAGIEDLAEVVWGQRDGHTADLREELRARPEHFDILVAEATEPMTADGLEVEPGQVVCGAWVRYTPGTDFCSFWGRHDPHCGPATRDLPVPRDRAGPLRHRAGLPLRQGGLLTGVATDPHPTRAAAGCRHHPGDLRPVAGCGSGWR